MYQKTEPGSSSAFTGPAAQYDKNALDLARKRDYLRALNGHYEYASANTLRNSVKCSCNMDTKLDRLTIAQRGGQFANTAYVFSSFNKKVSHFIVNLNHSFSILTFLGYSSTE